MLESNRQYYSKYGLVFAAVHFVMASLLFLFSNILVIFVYILDIPVTLVLVRIAAYLKSTIFDDGVNNIHWFLLIFGTIFWGFIGSKIVKTK